MKLTNENKFLIKKKSFYSFLIFVSGFIFSYLYMIHTKDKFFPDQIVYYNLFDKLKGRTFDQSFAYYQSYVASLEIFHFFYIFISLKLGLSKEIAMSFANAILVYFISKSIFRFINPSLISSFFILSNHYTLNLFFILERFKFSIIFLFVLLYFYKKNYIKIAAFLLSLLSHFSLLILYLIYFFNKIKISKVKSEFTNSFVLKKKNLIPIILIIFLIFTYLLFEKHFQIKFTQFFSYFELKIYLINALKILLFFILIAFVNNQSLPKEVFYTYIYFILLELAFSNTRVVFFSFLYFLYYVSKCYNLTRRNFVLFIFFTYSCAVSLNNFFFILY
jgi:hypothetical protein